MAGVNVERAMEEDSSTTRIKATKVKKKKKNNNNKKDGGVTQVKTEAYFHPASTSAKLEKNTWFDGSMRAVPDLFRDLGVPLFVQPVEDWYPDGYPEVLLVVEAAKPSPRPVFRYYRQVGAWRAGTLRQFTIHNWAELHDFDLSLKQAGVPLPIYRHRESSWMHPRASHRQQTERDLAVFRTEFWLAESEVDGAAPVWQVIIDRELLDSKGRNDEVDEKEEADEEEEGTQEVHGVKRLRFGTTTFVNVRKFKNPVELSTTQKIWQQWFYGQDFEPVSVKDNALQTRRLRSDGRNYWTVVEPTQQEREEWTQDQAGKIEAIRERQNNKKQLQREQKKDKKKSYQVRNKDRDGSRAARD